jgi:hypothetical protein
MPDAAARAYHAEPIALGTTHGDSLHLDGDIGLHRIGDEAPMVGLVMEETKFVRGRLLLTAEANLRV